MVVAAGGWEALRVPTNPNGTAVGDSGVGGGSSGGGDNGRGGNLRGGVGGCHGGSSRCLTGNTGSMSFAAQVCARESRAEEEARNNADEDDDDDLDSSGPGSDNDDTDLEQHRGGAATVRASSEASVMTRSQSRNASCGATVDSSDSSGGSGGRVEVGASLPVRHEGAAEPPPMPDALHARLPGNCRSEEDEEEDARGGDANVCTGGLGGLSLVHQSSSFDSAEAEDDEDEEEDYGGWGQVVVKPVKVSQWDKQGQRSKAQLSLNQLRSLILQRAENTPQKVTYRRAANLVRFVRSVGFLCVSGTAGSCSRRCPARLPAPQIFCDLSRVG